MLFFVLEFDNERDLRAAEKKLWGRLGIRGELGIRPLDKGRWLMEVHSEKNLRETTLEKLPGRMVEVS